MGLLRARKGVSGLVFGTFDVAKREADISIEL